MVAWVNKAFIVRAYLVTAFNPGLDAPEPHEYTGTTVIVNLQVIGCHFSLIKTQILMSFMQP